MRGNEGTAARETWARRPLPAFSDDARLRLLLGTLLYLAQGLPQGVTFYAIPAWLAARGQGSAAVGAAAAAASLPWATKFVAGAVVDRYTWLPMGRRRPWLVGSQLLVAASFLLFAVVSPPANATALVVALVLLISSMTAVQDTALDALVIDLTPEAEKGRLNGFMLAGKVLGISGGAAIATWLMQHRGVGAAMSAMLVLFAIPALAAVLVRERPGEKLLPWTAGGASPEAAAVAPEAWWPVLRLSLASLLRRDTLLVIGLLACYGIGQTLCDQGASLFAIRRLGWGEGDFGSLVATQGIALAAFCPIVAGPAIDRFGPKAMALVAGTASMLGVGSLALMTPWWGNGTVYVAWYFVSQLATGLFYLIFLVLAMRVSAVEVAATSFALIIATEALGASAGGLLLPRLDGYGGFRAIFGAAALVYFVAGLFPLYASHAVGATLPREASPPGGIAVPAAG